VLRYRSFIGWEYWILDAGTCQQIHWERVGGVELAGEELFEVKRRVTARAQKNIFQALEEVAN